MSVEKYRVVKTLHKYRNSLVDHVVSESGQHITIKAYANEEQHHKRFKYEVWALTQLLDYKSQAFPQILRSYNKEQPTIYLEFIPGCDLVSFMESNPFVPVELLMALIKQILPALIILQKLNMAHGDIKLDNIILQPFDDMALSDAVFKLIDYGSVYGHPEQLVATQPENKWPVGTSGYLSPRVCELYTEGIEQTALLTLEDYCRNDVFALGVVLFRLMYHGSEPFELLETPTMYTAHDFTKPRIPKPLYWDPNNPTLSVKLLDFTHSLLTMPMTPIQAWELFCSLS